MKIWFLISKIGASLMAQMIKKSPAMRETWVGKIPWRRERLPSPVFLPEEFRGQRSLVAIVHAVAKSLTRLSNEH